MDFAMAMNYIEEKTKLGTVPGLVNIKELLKELGNPQKDLKCLHIAGTNGKGSIFAFMQEILISNGFVVGRYISPTIFDYLERFQINKEYMDEETFANILTKVSVVVDKMIEAGFSSPTAFEIETAVAFLYFKEQKVDYVLLECGMGGSLDATNVLESPLATVMASISYDHMQFLGDTLSEIAGAKAGIIKENSICVSYPQKPEVSEVLRERCNGMNGTYVEIEKNHIEIIDENTDKTDFSYKGEEYSIGLIGRHQVYNAAVAIELAKRIFNFRRDSILEGLRNTKWPGRMTKVYDKPCIFIDGAHNEKAWSMLSNTVNKHFTNKEIIYIIGVLKDKEYDRMVDILKDTMSYAIAITPNSPRGLDKSILADLLLVNGVPADTADTCRDAISKAVAKAGKDDVIMVCGSLSFLGEYLNFDYEDLF